jgi:hypothetical protein
MTLHLWRTDLLAQDLVTNRLPERSAAHYLMASAALYVQSNYSALWFGAYRDWAFFLELVVVLAVSLIGVNECYKANGGSDGTQFITRYCALSVPIGIKIAVLGIVLGQGFYYASPFLLGGGIFSQPQLVYRYVSFIMPIAFTFLYFWRIASHLGNMQARPATRASSAL